MTRYQWGAFALWAVVDIAIVAWLFWTVKKSDDESDPAEELTRALETEMREYNERRRAMRPTRNFEGRAFALDPDDPRAA